MVVGYDINDDNDDNDGEPYNLPSSLIFSAITAVIAFLSSDDKISPKLSGSLYFDGWLRHRAV